MENKQDNKKQSEREMDKALAATGLKVKRTRHFRREILSNDEKVLVTNVIHTPVKGEKISDTRRTDMKFSRRQNLDVGRAI